ncbi:MAG: hypothetical protein WBI07_19810 [Mobilitalea sp.]
MDEQNRPVLKKKIRYDEIKETLQEMSDQNFVLEIELEREEEDVSKESL